MTPLSVHAHSAAPPDRVWEVLSDLESWPSWMPTIDILDPEVPGRPPGAGTAYAVKQPRLPRARWVVTDWRPGRGFTWQSSTPGATTIGTHDLTPHANAGTDIALAIAWTGPLAWLARAAFGRMTRRYVETEMAALVARSEAAQRPA